MLFNQLNLQDYVCEIAERFQQLNMSNKEAIHQQTEQNYGYNTTKSTSKTLNGVQQQKESEEYEEEYEDGEKTSYTSSTTTPHSRCSRGVSTEEEQDVQNNKTKLVISSSPPPPPPCNCNSSIAEKLNQRERGKLNSNYPKRLGDGESAAPSSRYSVLLQLIACGSSGADFKAKEEARLSNVGTKRRESVDEKQKPYSEDINCVSENPRMLLGNLQSEEKEYFSGSIVESIKANRVAFEAEPVLKKSNSYNEER